MSEDIDRSLASIDRADLLHLAALAADAEAELFERNPRGSRRYADRLLGRALCQGAALHYMNGKNGVKDFDVWSFYAQHDDWPFPVRWRGTRDFGPSKFGRYPGDPPQYTGRRVDLLGRGGEVVAWRLLPPQLPDLAARCGGQGGDARSEARTYDLDHGEGRGSVGLWRAQLTAKRRAGQRDWKSCRAA